MVAVVLRFCDLNSAFDVYVDVHGEQNQHAREKANGHPRLMHLLGIENQQGEGRAERRTSQNMNRNQKISLPTADAGRFELDDAKNSSHDKNRGECQSRVFDNCICQHDSLYVTGVHR